MGSSIEMVDSGNLKKVWTSIQTDMMSHQDKKELTSAKLEETYKDTLKKLKPTLRFESEKRPAVHHFSELFLTSLPEIAASSSLTETQLLTSLADLHSKSPKSGDEIKERLGLVDIDDPSPLPKSGEVFMNDQDLEKVLRETQAEVKRKPHLRLGQKSAGECFAELLLSKAPTLKQHSNLTEPDLRLNIAKLYNLKALNAATVKSSIGVYDGGHLTMKPELEPSIAHTKKDIQPGIIDQIKMPAQEKEELATNLWGTNLKPVTMVPIEEADKSKDEIVHLVDDEKLGATTKYDNDLIEMIKDFRLKPINKETKAPNLKDIPEETLNTAITNAKSAVCQNIDMKPRKKSEITQDFVDVLLRELPVSTLPSQVTKDALVSKIENMSSIEMVNPSNLKKEWRSIETGKSSHPVKKELSSANIEEAYKNTLKKLKPTQTIGGDKTWAVQKFSELLLTSLPEIAKSSPLTETQLLASLADLHNTSPKNGDEIKEKLGLGHLDHSSHKSGQVFMNDQDLEKLLMETQAEVKRKTHLKLGQKSPGEQFAELLMSKAAKLQQHSNLTHPELKHSLTKLYNVNDLNASIIKSSLGFQEEGPLDENQELEQMPKLNENQQQPCSREHIKIPPQEREEFDINLRGINLKPARKVPMDEPDNKPDDEIQGATANQDKKLLDMINDLRLKPIDKETKAPYLKDIPEETLHTAITKAKSAVHSDSNIKHQKKSQISKDFVDILLKELPISTLPSQLAKDDLVSKIEDMSSIEMVDPGNLKKVWTSIQTDMTSHQDKKELTSAKLEEKKKK